MPSCLPSAFLHSIFLPANNKWHTDAIFTVRQMRENFRVKGKKLYFGFVDLEKAFDRVNFFCATLC